MAYSQKQTVQTDLLAWQAIAANAAPVISTAYDCRELLGVRLGFYFGLDSATTPVGTQFIVQGSDMDSGDTGWTTLDTIITGTVAPSAIVVDNAEAGPVIECGATVPALNDLILFKQGTITLSEIRRVVARVTTGGSESFTTDVALTTNTGAGSTYYTKAELYNRSYDVSGLRRIQVIANNNYAASSASCVVRVSLVTYDSIQVVA